MAEKITDKLAAAALRQTGNKFAKDTIDANRDARAQAERDQADRDHAREQVQKRIIQRRLFQQIQKDAREVATELANNGVVPDPDSEDGSHAIDRTHKDSPATSVYRGPVSGPKGKMFNPDTGRWEAIPDEGRVFNSDVSSREWEAVPAHASPGLARTETVAWPLRVTSVHKEGQKTDGAGRPKNYEKTGIAMAAGTGELIHFTDADMTHRDRLVDLREPLDARADPRTGDRRPVVADDLVPLDSIKLGVVLEDQPVLAEWQDRIVHVGSQAVAGVPVTPDWVHKS